MSHLCWNKKHSRVTVVGKHNTAAMVNKRTAMATVCKRNRYMEYSRELQPYIH